MNFTGKPKINILLVGLPGVGKTSLCQAFGSNFVEGFSYGVGLSKKAKMVELITDQSIYHVIDAPGVYDARDETNTQRHAAEISNKLNLFSTPYVVCFVICIQQHDMRVKMEDLLMMRAIKQYYSRGQVKFSVIINRLTEGEFKVFADNSQFRKEFLLSFEREVGIRITDDNILLIHDKFLTHSVRDQKELLTSYVKKFEAGYMSDINRCMSDFTKAMKNAIEADGISSDKFMASYNDYSKAYQDEIFNIINQQVKNNQNNSMQMFQQSLAESQKQQTQMMQQMLNGNNGFASYQTPQQNSSFYQFMPGGNINPSAPHPYTSPLTPNNNFLNQYLQQSATNSSNLTNSYVNQFLNGGNGSYNNANSFQSPFTSNSNVNNPYNMGSFQQTAPSPVDSNTNSSTNNMFSAAGAFVGGALGVPTTSDFGPSNTSMYGAAGQFVGGAVTAGCSIM